MKLYSTKRKIFFCFVACFVLSGCTTGQKTVYRSFAVFQTVHKGIAPEQPEILGRDNRKIIRIVSTPDTVRFAYVQTAQKVLVVDSFFFEGRLCKTKILRLPASKKAAGRQKKNGYLVYLPAKKQAWWWQIAFLPNSETDSPQTINGILIKGRLNQNVFQINITENIELEPQVAM